MARRRYRKSNQPRAHREERCWCGHTAAERMRVWVVGTNAEVGRFPVCASHLRLADWEPGVKLDFALAVAGRFGQVWIRDRYGSQVGPVMLGSDAGFS